MPVKGDQDPHELLKTYRVSNTPIFVVGIFDKGVTVHAQQVRALSLAWALVESGEVDAGLLGDADTSRKQIAIVGAGFAGLTLAAGLIK